MQICRYDKITKQFECKFCDFSIIAHVSALSFRIHHEFFIPAGFLRKPAHVLRSFLFFFFLL